MSLTIGFWDGLSPKCRRGAYFFEKARETNEEVGRHETFHVFETWNICTLGGFSTVQFVMNL